MKRSILYLFFFTCVFLASQSKAISICNGSDIDGNDNDLLQDVIQVFAMQMRCDTSNTCLSRLPDKGGASQYQITWLLQCGPIVGGNFKFKKNGYESTFFCKPAYGKTCCWPVGFESNEEYITCSQ